MFLLVFVLSIKSYSQEPPPSPQGQQPSLTGNWTSTIHSSEITEAGSDFYGTYESANNQLVFNRNGTYRSMPNWNVSINKADVVWNSNIKLWIRRTGDGTGVSGSTISNGASYLEILNTPINFFYGYREVNEVPLQLKLTGISVVIPANMYSTILTFTVTEN